MRLRQAESAQHLALRQRAQPELLLLSVAVFHQDRIDRAVGHADDSAGSAVSRRNLFQHQRQTQVVHARAAQLLRHADTVSAQCGQPLMHIFGEVMLLVPARGMRGDLLMHKVAHGIADHFLVLVQQHECLRY